MCLQGCLFLPQLLEVDIHTHEEKVNDVEEAALGFKDAKHFMNKELQSRAKEVGCHANLLMH